MKWHLCLVITTFVISLSAKAESYDHNIQNPPLVEVLHSEDIHDSYRERRTANGLLVSLNAENFFPKNYLSTLDNAIYTDLYGKNAILIVGIELAYKYNFSLGSMTLGAGYGAGTIDSSASGDARTLEVTRPFGSVAYIMDALFNEPYVVPYAELKIWQIGVSETSSTDTYSANTGVGFTYSIGALFQLNALDSNTARGAIHEYGLENTYIDFYMAKYTQTQSAQDADTETDFNYGAGLRLEF